eukprot:COSAG01_NODE_7302_length_3261_cov_1.785895_2_plen_80_part_00
MILLASDPASTIARSTLVVVDVCANVMVSGRRTKSYMDTLRATNHLQNPGLRPKLCALAVIADTSGNVDGFIIGKPSLS